MGCAWMLDQFPAWEGSAGAVATFVRGARHWFGGLAANASLFHAQGPHSGENFLDYAVDANAANVGRVSS